MEFPPDEWSCFPMGEFELAEARNPMDCGVELLVQARANGRMLDHARMVLGGSKLLEVKIPFRELLSVEETPDWELVYTTWPRQIAIRRNMATSDWFDVRDLILSNDGRVQLKEGGNIEAKEAVDYLDTIPDRLMGSAALRWAVLVGDDRKLRLALQGLPSPAASFSGKPAFRG